MIATRNRRGPFAALATAGGAEAPPPRAFCVSRVPRFLESSNSSQLNVTVCRWPSSLDDVFDTVCRLPIIPTSAALSSTVCG